MSDWFASRVSRETLANLRGFADYVCHWNARINLVSSKDQDNIAVRHIADSAQVFFSLPAHVKTCTDMGSGGGFPGIVCAIMGKEVYPNARFILIESDLRKAVFLQECQRKFDLPVTVLNQRIEDVEPHNPDAVTARALAPLPKLLDYASHLGDSNMTVVLPKGKQYEAELTKAMEQWSMKVDRIPSRTDPNGTILRISELQKR